MRFGALNVFFEIIILWGPFIWMSRTDLAHFFVINFFHKGHFYTVRSIRDKDHSTFSCFFWLSFADFEKSQNGFTYKRLCSQEKDQEENWQSQRTENTISKA